MLDDFPGRGRQLQAFGDVLAELAKLAAAVGAGGVSGVHDTLARQMRRQRTAGGLLGFLRRISVVIASVNVASVVASTRSASCSSSWSVSRAPRSDDAPNLSRRGLAMVSLRLAISASRSSRRASAAISMACSVATSLGSCAGSVAMRLNLHCFARPSMSPGPSAQGPESRAACR